jgi:hypothetical protein
VAAGTAEDVGSKIPVGHGASHLTGGIPKAAPCGYNLGRARGPGLPERLHARPERPSRPTTRLADAVAALQREHNINPSTIPMRVWRHLYIQGRNPQKAADQAAASAHNVRSAADRLKRR